MNIKLFNELMQGRPSQHLPEWQLFLEICEMYLKQHDIKRPVVVELGVWRNKQKQFYEKLLGAEHIGIDVSSKRSIPDIQGNTHDRKTLAELKKRLDGRPINVLFIDAGHSYEDVKKDFEIYEPLCNNIVALHDITKGQRDNIGIYKFWHEIKDKATDKTGRYRDFLFIAINKCHFMRKIRGLGIGIIIKK